MEALPAQSLPANGTMVAINLRDYFGLPGVTGPLVQFDTTFGRFNVELLSSAAPVSVTNFQSYVNSGVYTNSIVHRSVPGFVIQGGGFQAVTSLDAIPTNAPIVLEYNLPNVRGTLSMARTAELNSATSQWFINTVDNTTNLGPANGGGYAVFARVLGTGMTVVDVIAALPRYSLGSGTPFTELPLHDVQNNQLNLENLVVVNQVQAIGVYPDVEGHAAVLAFALANSAPAVVTASVSGSELRLTPGSLPGVASITVTVTDTNGNTATGIVSVTVNSLIQSIAFAALADRSFQAEAIS